MIKNLLLCATLAFFFSACSFKMPFDIPFISSKKDTLKEANICQSIELKEKKIECYEDILDENSYAQLRMGIYYADKREFKKAFDLLNLANKNNNLYSNLALAFLYYKGDGVEQNLEKSFELLNQSKDIDPNAAYQLSRFYIQGINVDMDIDKALELLKFAANKDMKIAQEKLVHIYKNGLYGLQKDDVNVKYWEDKIKENKKDLSFNIYKL